MGVRKIHPARAAAAGFFGTQGPARRIPCPQPVDVILQIIIVAGDVRLHDHVRPAGCGDGDGSGRIQPVAPFPHGRDYPLAFLFPFHAPFLVAYAPEDDARVVEVPFYHTLQLAPVLGAAAQEPVLVDYQHAEAVADVEQRRRSGIVAAAYGIAAQFHYLLHAVKVEGVRNG